MFNSELRIYIKTDILGFVLGVVISQLFPDPRTGREIWYFIIFWSRKMIGAEYNYKIYDGELFIIIAAFKE